MGRQEIYKFALVTFHCMLILLYVFYKLSLSILPHWGVLFNVEIGVHACTPLNFSISVFIEHLFCI